jgi:uncharacterized phiE125 gp8 family phage protein
MIRPMLRQTCPPGTLPIDRETVWAHLELILEETDDSPPELAPIDAAYVDDLIRAAVSRLDGPHGLLNRCLISQDWQFSLPRFPRGAIRVPVVRCIDVISVSYVATDGSPKTLPETDWISYGLETDHATIAPAPGKRWPATLHCPEAVTVEVEAGFGASPSDVPGSIKLAILEMVASAYEHREDITVGSVMPLPSAASRVVTDWTSWTSLDADHEG